MSDTNQTETDTNTNTDEPTKAELHDRVQQLESTVAKMMPSRRDALRMGAAGLAGAAGLGAASQTADASTGSAGTIGSSGSRPDMFTDDINTRRIGNIVFAEGFNGSDPESRLDNALTAVGAGDRLMLENATYTKNRNISFAGVISGLGGAFRGVVVTGDWTFSRTTGLFHLEIGGNFTHDKGFAQVFDCFFNGGSLTVNGNDMVITHCADVDVTLNSSSNVVALNRSNSNSITDNGSGNQIGLNG